MKEFTFLCSRVAVRTIFWVGGMEEVVMGLQVVCNFYALLIVLRYQIEKECIVDCFGFIQ